MTSRAEGDPRLRLAVLGSTGSVGQSSLRVVRQHSDRLRVVGLAARGGQPEDLLDQVREFSPRVVAITDASVAATVRPRLPPETELLSGEDAAVRLIERCEPDRVVAAIVGAAGLPPVHAALEAGIDVALANKEALVVAGGLLIRTALRTGAAVLPVDSEHAALH
ncbi:MAG: 1-deoxy-D-xylulose-5-phosphate reductoisomerase, partial [Thermoanaerobaculia bacterium]|nr:1-deoxy-D-xylulose-5-phosphate reductoisomerase [Thermoanaerobaculia bacterium]